MSDRLQQLLEMHQQSPEDEFLRFAIAKEHEKYGRKEDALKWYLQLQEQSPQYIGTYYHLGKLYESLGEPALAFRSYTTGMEAAKSVGDQHALSELAGARLALGDEEDFE